TVPGKPGGKNPDRSKGIEVPVEEMIKHGQETGNPETETVDRRYETEGGVEAKLKAKKMRVERDEQPGSKTKTTLRTV
ncbi:E domain-containing protein, partial [Staphylococcus aureus]